MDFSNSEVGSSSQACVSLDREGETEPERERTGSSESQRRNFESSQREVAAKDEIGQKMK